MTEDVYYFRKELDYLHKTRQLLISKYPKLAPFLAYNSNDPDVERIIESLAILSSRINKELDANIPFIAESLINILIPNYTNSIPSVCMQEFKMSDNCSDNKLLIPANTVLKSALVGTTSCEFRTIYDVYLYPVKITNVAINSEGKYNALTIDIETTRNNLFISDLAMDYLNIYLGNDVYTSNTLLLWLLQYVKDIIIMSYDSKEQVKIPLSSIESIGFLKNENLLNNDDIGFSSFSLLQELLLMPEKFHFIRLRNLNIVNQFKVKKIGIKFIFNKDVPKDCMPRINHFSLSATPAINLFPMQAEPILLDHTREGYRIFVDRSNMQSYSVIQVLKVKAHSSDTGRRILKNYYSFERFAFINNKGDFYSLANKIDSNGEYYKEISFYSTKENKETISIDLLCSNNNLPSSLKLGEINEVVGYKDVNTSNLTLPTNIKHVKIDNSIAWNLVSTLSFSYQTMLNKESFLSIVYTYLSIFETYDTHFFTNLSDALIDIKPEVIYRIEGFITRRGVQSILYIDDSKFYCIGEVYKIGLVLSHFFSSFASINSFCELRIICTSSDVNFTFPMVNGNKALI